MTQPEPPISTWRVYEQLAEVSAKLSVLIAQGADHEARLRMLEKGRWPQSNIATLVGLAGVVAAVLIAIFRH